MSYYLTKLILLAICVVYGNCLLVQNNGSCPQNLPVMSNFDENRYQGLWYEIRKFNPTFNANAICNRFNLTQLQNNSLLANFSGIVSVLSRPYVVLAALTALNPNMSNSFLQENLNGGIEPTNNRYTVLDTDYANYSVNYICLPGGVENLWIYGRNQTLPQQFIDRIKQNLPNLASAIDSLSVDNQANCQPGVISSV